jgi:hypothetical protein
MTRCRRLSFDPRWSDERPRQDRDGKRWNFRYWYSGWSRDETRKAQRLFFWNDAKSEYGVVIFLPGTTVRYGRIADLINNLTAKSALRAEYNRELQFPLEEHYSDFGAFPEEARFIEAN